MLQIDLKTEFQLIEIQQNKQSVIYEIRNLINNKVYIGKSVNILIRKRQHENSFKRNCAVNLHLQNAINKYGIENFKFSILEITNSELINVRETFWISKFNSFDEKYGYNKTTGGDGGNLTIETKIKISNSSPNKKMVYQFSKTGELLKIWKSVSDIERTLGYLRATISKACSKKTINKSAYGYYWSYDIINHFCGIGQENKKIKIIQCTLDNEIINVWDSISEAAINTNSSKSSIIRCCKNKQKSCNGFIWKYKL